MDINISFNNKYVSEFEKQTKAVKEWINEENPDVDKRYNDDDKEKKLFDEFLRGTGIASIGQGRFTEKSKKAVQDNWKDVFPLLKKLISHEKTSGEPSHDKAVFDTCKDLQNKLTSLCGKDRKPWAAIHVMIVALKPDYFCSIVSENNLDALYKELENIHPSIDGNEDISSEEDSIINDGIKTKVCFKGGKAWKKLQEEWNAAKDKDNVTDKMTWYYKSHAIKNYYVTIDNIKSESISEYPWATLVALRGETKINNLVERLKTQRNIIFIGAPGTGKTFLARSIAAKMTGLNLSALQRSEQYDFVQFHPSYDYTDFVEGLRPDKGNRNRNAIVFKRQDGIFKAFCKVAAYAEIEDENKKEENKRKFVFVIDEINRGEISKIFGELFFSIDPGYRGETDKYGVSNRIKTQYQNLVDIGPFKNGFYVPDNVFVIGTMNDIDRSVESMDFAFRRRFAFYEITAQDSEGMIYAKDDWDPEKQQITVDRMRALNNAIVDKGGLSEQYQIGGAYFLKLKDVGFNFNRLWNEYLRGTLYEYFRGLPAKEIEEKLKLLKSAYDSGSEE